jgi:hypothetical protein
MKKLLKQIVIINLFILLPLSAFAIPERTVLQVQAKDCMTVYQACYADCSRRYVDMVSTTQLSTEALNCYKKCTSKGRSCSKIFKQLKELDKELIYPNK